MTDLIGIAIWNFGDIPLADRIDRFVSMGYSAVSLNTRDAAPMVRGEMPSVEEALLRHQLPITIHGGLAPKGEPLHSHILDDFRGYADWHARTGLLVTVNYDVAKTQDGSSRCEEMRDTLSEMLTISDGSGFTVGIEDWPRCNEDLHWVEKLRRHPHYGMLIDLGHLNMRIDKTDDPSRPFSADAARAYLERMELPVNELHIHNNDGRRDLHAPPDSGTADFTAIAELLASLGKLDARGSKCVSTVELAASWCGLSDEEGWAAAERALPFWRDIPLSG